MLPTILILVIIILIAISGLYLFLLFILKTIKKMNSSEQVVFKVLQADEATLTTSVETLVNQNNTTIDRLNALLGKTTDPDQTAEIQAVIDDLGKTNGDVIAAHTPPSEDATPA